MRRWRVTLVAASTAIAAVVSACAYWLSSLGAAPLGEGLAFSTMVVDRDGKLLRPYTTPEGRWRLPATRENVDPRFLELLLAYEDKRFRTHPGVDPLALGRAFTQLIIHGRIVSGASTITMQVARLLERPEVVTVSAIDIDGKEFTFEVSGLAARCVLHETDHINGKLFIEFLSPLKRDLLKRRIKKKVKLGEWE